MRARHADRRTNLCVALLVLLAGRCAPGLCNEPSQKVPNELTKVDDLFAKWNRLDSPGCVVGVVRDGDFVGVAAPSEFLASRAVKAIQADWKLSPQISSQELFDSLKKPSGEAGIAMGLR